MEPLKNATQEANIPTPGFRFANDEPCRISAKARRKALETAAELFSFSNTDVVDELISAKRKAYTDPKKSAKKKKKLDVTPPVNVDTMSDWEEDGDDEIEWSDCDADLSRTVEDLDKSLRHESSEENSIRSE